MKYKKYRWAAAAWGVGATFVFFTIYSISTFSLSVARSCFFNGGSCLLLSVSIPYILAAGFSGYFYTYRLYIEVMQKNRVKVWKISFLTALLVYLLGAFIFALFQGAGDFSAIKTLFRENSAMMALLISVQGIFGIWFMTLLWSLFFGGWLGFIISPLFIFLIYKLHVKKLFPGSDRCM